MADPRTAYADEAGDKSTEISDAKADGEKLGKLMDMMADACAKMDAVGSRLDAMEERQAKADARMDAMADAKKDGEDEDEIEAKGEPKEPAADRKDAEEEKKEEAKADAKRKDEDKEEKEEHEEAKADSVARAGLETLRAELASVAAKLPRALTDAEREEFGTIQAQADSVYVAFGGKAPPAMEGETPIAYKRRLASGLQSHSAKWGKTRLSAIPDAEALDVIVGEVYADAMTAARKGVDLPKGQLRAITHRGDAGHTIIEYEGSHPSWMSPFAGNVLKAQGDWRTPR